VRGSGGIADMNDSQRIGWTEFAVEALIRVLGSSTIAFVLLIFLFLLREGVPTFFEVPPGNLLGTRWYPTFDLFGIMPLVLGSVLVTATAILIALPMGVATAVFVREVAPGWAREILKPHVTADYHQRRGGCTGRSAQELP